MKAEKVMNQDDVAIIILEDNVIDMVRAGEAFVVVDHS